MYCWISLAVQRLRLQIPNTGGMGLILCPGTRIPQAERPETNKNKRCTVVSYFCYYIDCFSIIWPSVISVNETGKFQQTNNSNFIVTWFGYFLRRYIVNTERRHTERSNTDKIKRKKWILLYRWKHKKNKFPYETRGESMGERILYTRELCPHWARIRDSLFLTTD